MTGKPIHPLLNRIINNDGILSMHRDKFEAEKRAAFAAGVKAAADLAAEQSIIPHNMVDYDAGWAKCARYLEDAIRAICLAPKAQ